MSLYLSHAYVKQHGAVLPISTFSAISAQKTDIVTTEPIPSSCWAKTIQTCTYTFTDCTCVGHFSNSTSEAVQKAAAKDPGMNECQNN